MKIRLGSGFRGRRWLRSSMDLRYGEVSGGGARGRDPGSDFPTQNFTIPRAWEILGEVDHLGRLVRGEVPAAVVDELVGRGPGPRLRNHVRHHQALVVADLLGD